MSELRSVRVADIKADAGFRPRGQSAVESAAASIAEPEPRESPFDQGYRQGQWDAEQSFVAERARYRELIAACEAIQPEPSEMLALLIAESVETLVRVTVGEASLDVDRLLARARCAASMVAEADGERLLCLHPDDLALLDNCDLPLPAIADATVRPGSLRVEHPTGWIEDGIAVRLDALREQLGLREPAQ